MNLNTPTVDDKTNTMKIRLTIQIFNNNELSVTLPAIRL